MSDFVRIILIVLFVTLILGAIFVLTRLFIRKAYIAMAIGIVITVVVFIYGGGILYIVCNPLPPPPEDPAFKEINERKESILERLEALPQEKILEMESETDDFVAFVNRVFAGEAPSSETTGTRLDVYNDNSNRQEDAGIEHTFERKAVYLDNNKGEMWVSIGVTRRDSDGNLLRHLGIEDEIWDIEKIDGEWQLVKVLSHP